MGIAAGPGSASGSDGYVPVRTDGKRGAQYDPLTCTLLCLAAAWVVADDALQERNNGTAPDPGLEDGGRGG